MIIFVILVLMAAVCYLLGAAWYSNLWSRLLEISPVKSKDDFFWSIATLLVATVIWPVVVCVCYSDLLERKIRRYRQEERHEANACK